MVESLLFIVAAVIGYYLNTILIEYHNRTRISALPSEIQTQERWSGQSKPLVGGISFYLIFLVSLAAYNFFPGANTEEYFSTGLPLLLSGSLGFIIGLADDAYTTKPFLKFLGQVLCGVILIACGISISLTDLWVADYALTLFWVVGIMNSINMLDNMDGVTGSVSAGILIILLMVLGLTESSSSLVHFCTIILLGSLSGFLCLNWKPAKLYMGDTGSQFLGVFLAYIGIVYFWNHDAYIGLHKYTSAENFLSRQLILPVLAFLIPILDTTFVSIARIARRQSPFVGGKDHTTHHLVYFGVPEWIVPVIMFAITILSGVLVLFAISIKKGWTHTHSVSFILFIAAKFSIFAYIYRQGAMNLKQKHLANSTPQAPEKKIPEQVKAL